MGHRPRPAPVRPSSSLHPSRANHASHRSLLPASAAGFDVVILSDLLHFDASHDVLLASLTALLRRAPDARAYVAAGRYTAPAHCAQFVRMAAEAGLVLEEGTEDVVEGGTWRGIMEVSGGGLDRAQLGVRKGMCRWWVGRWAEFGKA